MWNGLFISGWWRMGDRRERTREAGRRLAQARTERGLSQEQVARRTSLSRRTVWRIETGRVNAPHGHIVTLARVLGLRLDSLHDDND